MSEERVLEIFAESRTLHADENRDYGIFRELRSLSIQNEEREVEVNLP